MAARRAGKLIREQYGKPHQIRFKGDPRDLVTETDRAAEAAALELIRSRHPDHAILSEEDPHSKPGPDGRWNIPPGVVWMVDPLDGTTNYASAIPFVSVSVGVAIDRQPVVGAIYDPLRDELFLAAGGLGATLNGRTLGPLAPVPLERAVLSVDWTHTPAIRSRSLAMVTALAARCRTVRALGSAALGLAYVACNRVQMYLSLGLQPWDTCAGAIIIREAGGAVVHPDQPEWQIGQPALLAAHSELLTQAREVLKDL